MKSGVTLSERYSAAMSKLDVARERIAYLKIWLGIVVVTNIGLVGWLASNAELAPAYKVWAAVSVVVVITYAGSRIHRKITRAIEALEEM